MRRITTVAVCTGLILGGLGTTASAAAPKRWETKGGYDAVKAGGTYTRSAGKVTVRGWLTDQKANGWAAALQFSTSERGKKRNSSVFFFLADGKPADFAYAKQDYGKFYTSDLTEHLYVRECGVRPNKGRATKCGTWRKLF